MRRCLKALCAGLVAGLLFPVMGAAATGGTQLNLTPARVRVGTTVTVRFHQPAGEVMIPGQRSVETLDLTGPAGGSCVGAAEMAVAPSAPGTAMRETLRPARLGDAQWCAGVHDVALTIARYTTCSPEPQLHFCPLAVVVPTVVATASFRVIRG